MQDLKRVLSVASRPSGHNTPPVSNVLGLPLLPLLNCCLSPPASDITYFAEVVPPTQLALQQYSTAWGARPSPLSTACK